MRKKVEPHTAVTETSRSVASRACRAEPAEAVTAGSDDRQGDGAALGRLAATGGSCSRTVPKNPPRARRTVTLNPWASRVPRACCSCWPTTSGTVTSTGPFDTTSFTVSPCRCRRAALADHLALGDGVAVLLLGRVDLQPEAAQLAGGAGGVLAGEVGHVDRLRPRLTVSATAVPFFRLAPGPGLGRDHLTLGHLLVVRLGDLAHLEVDLLEAGPSPRRPSTPTTGCTSYRSGPLETTSATSDPRRTVVPGPGGGRDDDALGDLLAERLVDTVGSQRRGAHGGDRLGLAALTPAPTARWPSPQGRAGRTRP